MYIQELLRYNGYISLLDYILYLYNTENYYCFTFIKCLQKEDINKFILKFVELLDKKYKETDFISLIDIKTKCKKCYLFEWIEIMNVLETNYEYELVLRNQIKTGYFSAIFLYKSRGYTRMNEVVTLCDYTLNTGSYMTLHSRDELFYRQGSLTDELLQKSIY